NQVRSEGGERHSAEQAEDQERLSRLAGGSDDRGKDRRHHAHQRSESIEGDPVILERAETELLAMLRRLDANVQIAVSPCAEPTGRRRAPLGAKGGPEFSHQSLPLSLRRGSRKVDPPCHADRQAEGSPHGCGPSASIELLGGLRDSSRLNARLVTDAL